MRTSFWLSPSAHYLEKHSQFFRRIKVVVETSNKLRLLDLTSPDFRLAVLEGKNKQLVADVLQNVQKNNMLVR